MSISIMSFVFYADIPKIEFIRWGERKTDHPKNEWKKGDPFQKVLNISSSSAKIVLLAYADHANDEGKSSYPSIARLEVKTGLSRVHIINTVHGLVSAGYLKKVGQSDRRTNDYQISISKLLSDQNESWSLYSKQNSLSKKDSKPSLPSDSKPDLPSIVNPVYPNHQENINLKHNNGDKSPKEKVSSSKKKSRDKRLDHPAIQIFRHFHRLHCPVVWRDDVLKVLGDDPQKIDTWPEKIEDIKDRDFVLEYLKGNPKLSNWSLLNKNWVGLGFKPGNIKGILDNYNRGDFLQERMKQQNNNQQQMPVVNLNNVIAERRMKNNGK